MIKKIKKFVRSKVYNYVMKDEELLKTIKWEIIGDEKVYDITIDGGEVENLSYLTVKTLRIYNSNVKNFQNNVFESGIIDNNRIAITNNEFVKE